MEVIRVPSKLTAEEREVHLSYSDVEKKWIMDTTILKFYNKALKQGWTPIIKYVYEDGAICGGVFEAPERSITVRNVEKKQLSQKQIQALT